MYAKQITQKKLRTGGTVLAAPFPAYGSVSVVGSVVGGSMRAKAQELAKIHAQMLLEGTTEHTKKEIQILLDSIGASLAFSTTDERLVFSARVRVEYLEKLLSLIGEILRTPAFPAAELTVLKKREEANLMLEAQDTNAQANILLSRLLYKKSHPNFDETTVESSKALAKITPQALKAFHASIVSSDSLVVSYSGDIRLKNVAALTEKSFSSLPRKKIAQVTFKKTSATAARKATKHIAQKASIDYLVGVATGITDTHPDFAALLIGTQVLGYRGGFNGRLMKIVREQEGLTYGIYSVLAGFTAKTDGHFLTWATFAPQLFEKGRASTLREIKRIIEDGITEEEAKKHREMFEARSRTQLSSSASLARAAHDLVVNGKKLSYLDEFPKKVLKLSAKEINRAIKKYLVTSKLSESAAGPIGK